MRILGRSMTDVVAGMSTSIVGLLVIAESWTYPMGTARDMGPGYFPTVAGSALVLLGIAITVIEGRVPRDEDVEFIHFRQIALLLGSILIFAGLVEPFGLAPATFAAVFLAALADRSSSLLFAAVLGCIVTAASVVAFVYGLGVQIPAIRW